MSQEKNVLEKMVKTYNFSVIFGQVSISNLTNKIISYLLCSLSEDPRQKMKRITHSSDLLMLLGMSGITLFKIELDPGLLFHCYN